MVATICRRDPSVTKLRAVAVLICILATAFSGCSTRADTRNVAAETSYSGIVAVDFKNGIIARVWRISLKNTSRKAVAVPVSASYRIGVSECTHFLHPDFVSTERRSLSGAWVPPQAILEEVEAPVRHIEIEPGESAEFLQFERDSDDYADAGSDDFRVIISDTNGVRHTSSPFSSKDQEPALTLSAPCELVD